MKDFPHHYRVSAYGGSEGDLSVKGENLPDITSAPPAEFDGPGNLWSPETLLMSSVASCMVLSFRAVANASRFEWVSIDCSSEGKLDRIDRVTRFTEIVNRVTLTIPAGSDRDKAEKLLHKAESVCLISNSLTADISLQVDIKEATD